MNKAYKSLLIVIFFSIYLSAQETCPDFSVKDIEGNTHKLYSYLDEGKYVVLYFTIPGWAGCWLDVDELNAVYNEYGCNDYDVVMLGITGMGGSNAQMKAEIAQKKYEFPIASAKEGGAQAVTNQHNVNSWPRVKVVRPNRTYAYKHYHTNNVLSNKLSNGGCLPHTCDITESKFTKSVVKTKNGIKFNVNKNILNFECSNSGNYSISLYGLNGKTINRLYNGHMEIGDYQFNLKGQSPFASGVYYLTVNNNGVKSINKLTIF